MYPKGSTLADMAWFCANEGMADEAATDAIEMLTGIHWIVNDATIPTETKVASIRGKLDQWAKREEARANADD